MRLGVMLQEQEKDKRMEIDTNDVIKLNDGDIYEVTGVIHDDKLVYFYQGGNEVSISFSEIDTLYKPQNP